MLPFVRYQAQPQWSTTVSYRHTFDTPWASGDAHIHTRLVGLLLQSYLIDVSILGGAWNSGAAPADRCLPRCSSAFLKTKKNRNASKPSNQSNGLVGGTIGCKGPPMSLHRVNNTISGRNPPLYYFLCLNSYIIM